MSTPLAPTGTFCTECEHEDEQVVALYALPAEVVRADLPYRVEITDGAVLVCDAHLEILTEG